MGARAGDSNLRAGEGARSLAAAAPQLHVINALTDEEHPCQALADCLTLRERWGDCRGRKVAYVGDGNNVATSLAHVTSMMGVTCTSPRPPATSCRIEVVERRRASRATAPKSGASPIRAQAVAGVDAVYTDVWTSMGEEARPTSGVGPSRRTR